ncbi:MAG: hypothetical protein KDA52_19165, partial [Planctomycetaceae bacterium]|nr:hypothetical protein [Planctomycetaceae bacterium]
MTVPRLQPSGNRLRLFAVLLSLRVFPSVSLALADERVDTTTSEKIVITGQITSESGSAVPSTRLQVWTFEDKPLRHWELMESPVVSEVGAFVVQELDAPVSLLFRAQADDLATGWSMLHLSEGGATETRIVMSHPGRVPLQVNDESGQPITDARVRWFKIDGPNGSVSLTSETFRDLDLPRPTSDKQGLLQIEDLPLSAKLTVGLLHDEHAPAEAKGVNIVEQGEPSTVVMNDGVPLRIQILTDELEAPIQEVTMDLRHQPIDHPSTLVFEQVPLDTSGRATVRIEAGSYRLLRFTHSEAAIGPVFACDYDKQRFLKFDDQTPVLTFHAKPMVEVQGRVTNAQTGAPIPGQYVSGETPNPTGNYEFSDFASPWRSTSWAKTDADGRYTMKLSPGPARISSDGQGYTMRARYQQVEIVPKGITELPTLEMVQIQPFRGQVLAPDGKPIKDAVVRFRGENLRWVQPAITDDDGRFQLEVPSIPVDEVTEELVLHHPVVAFHPHQPWVGTSWVDLGQPNETDHLEIALQPTNDWDLTHLFEDELTPHEQGHLREEERAELESMSLVGKPAPELDGRSWLNTPQSQMSLADFRGKYVLLDFWTTWC